MLIHIKLSQMYGAIRARFASVSGLTKVMVLGLPTSERLVKDRE